MKRNYFLLAGLITLLAVVGSFYFYAHLPAIVPIHWDAHGRVNGYGSKWVSLVMMPAVMALIVLLMAALPWLSPRKYGVSDGKPAYLQIMVLMLAFFAYLHIIILRGAAGAPMDVGKGIFGGICALFAALGPLLAKVPRNFYVGIRTPWTLANEQVWAATHRFGAWSFGLAGVVGLFLTLASAPFWMLIIVLAAAGLAPAIYSLVCYKQLEHRGAV